jgi:hypothetical protein
MFVCLLPVLFIGAVRRLLQCNTIPASKSSALSDHQLLSLPFRCSSSSFQVFGEKDNFYCLSNCNLNECVVCLLADLLQSAAPAATATPGGGDRGDRDPRRRQQRQRPRLQPRVQIDEHHLLRQLERRVWRVNHSYNFFSEKN